MIQMVQVVRTQAATSSCFLHLLCFPAQSSSPLRASHPSSHFDFLSAGCLCHSQLCASAGRTGTGAGRQSSSLSWAGTTSPCTDGCFFSFAATPSVAGNNPLLLHCCRCVN